MSTADTNSKPSARVLPKFTPFANGGVAVGTIPIRFLTSLLKYVSPSRMRLFQSFWSTPTSHEKLVSGCKVESENPGKKRSLKVGALKPEPAPPRIRVPHSGITYASEPCSVQCVPKSLLSSTLKPPLMNRRSQSRNVCSKKADFVWLLASNGVLPWATPSSVRYSSPMELVDHLPIWKWFRSSASQRSTSKRPGNSHGGNGHGSARSGRSTNVVLF